MLKEKRRFRRKGDVMDEVMPGIWHWTALHQGIGHHVNSYYLSPFRTLIDPMVPDEGVDWFSAQPPERIVLTNRHHYRHSDRFVEAYGCEVLCNELGLHEFSSDMNVRGLQSEAKSLPE
jgi:hypothetical protein